MSISPTSGFDPASSLKTDLDCRSSRCASPFDFMIYECGEVLADLGKDPRWNLRVPEDDGLVTLL